MITIGAGTIVHPRAEIRAEGGNCYLPCFIILRVLTSRVAGPIHIGENNIIEELALVHNQYLYMLSLLSLSFLNIFCFRRAAGGKEMTIGNNNLFEVGSRIFSYPHLFIHVLTCIRIIPCK